MKQKKRELGWEIDLPEFTIDLPDWEFNLPDFNIDLPEWSTNLPDWEKLK